MKPAVLLLALGLVGCASSGPRVGVAAGAQVAPAEEAAILAAMDRFFVAMAERDIESYAALQTHDGMTYSQRFSNGEWRLRRRTNQDHVQSLTDAERTVSETYWAPTVLIRGPIAVVWAPYEFRMDGKVSHCGVDVFEMLKIDGRWVMGNAM